MNEVLASLYVHNGLVWWLFQQAPISSVNSLSQLGQQLVQEDYLSAVIGSERVVLERFDKSITTNGTQIPFEFPLLSSSISL